jgi:hypothetical protein
MPGDADHAHSGGSDGPAGCGWSPPRGTTAWARASTSTSRGVRSLTGDVVVRELTLDSTVGEWPAHPVVGRTLLQELAADLPGGHLAEQADVLRMVGSMPMGKAARMLGGPALDGTLQRLIGRSRAATAPDRPPTTTTEGRDACVPR